MTRRVFRLQQAQSIGVFCHGTAETGRRQTDAECFVFSTIGRQRDLAGLDVETLVMVQDGNAHGSDQAQGDGRDN